MPSFQVFNRESGVALGIYQGANGAEALNAMARDAGYANFAAACDVASGDDIVAEPANEWIIEAADAHDRWGIVDAEAGPSEFATRKAAQAALDELVERLGWDRDALRVREIPHD